ncbi:MAG: glycosyltransferase family 2 protein [Endomicrobiales bacterium]
MEEKDFALSVVVPAYNEEEGIAEVIGDLERVLGGAKVRHEIIVINDGSSDRTAELARAAGARVIAHPVNVGYGQSLLTGFSHAVHDHVAMIDADGSYPAGELLKLLPYAPDFDMVIGARSGAHYWGTMLKFPARLIFLWLSEYVTGQTIPDANSGLRIMKKETLFCGPILCRGFSFSTTLTLMFISSSRFVKFVPIEYHARKGHSKVRIVRDTLRAAQVLVESIIYYNPMKLVLPLCLLPFAGFVTFAALFFWGTGWNTAETLGWAFVLLSFSLLLFVLGTVLDLMRLKK